MNNPYASASDRELLSVLLGEDVARTLERKSLSEVFGFGCGTRANVGVAECVRPYGVLPQISAAKELVARSLLSEMRASDVRFDQMGAVKGYLALRLGHLEHEAFHCLWLDSQYGLLLAEELAIGTVDQAVVHPREVVKSALACNAARVVFAHNHPSKNVTPSMADDRLTQSLKTALSLVGVSVVDHIIVGGNTTLSMAEQGLI